MSPVSSPSPRRSRHGWLVALTLVLPALGTPASTAGGGAADEMSELLRRSDVAANEPTSFRSRLLLQEQNRDAIEIEVWREGAARTLVRFLGAKHGGKYLLYLEKGVFFLSPGARNPIKLPRSYRLHGSATLDQVLGLRYSRDYEIAQAELSDDRAEVTFELRARDGKVQYPRVRYVVERLTARPTRAELRLRAGRLATSVEFLAWSPGLPLRPARLLLRDELRGGTETRVELIDLEERSVPPGLFSLSDGSARKQLEKAAAAGG